MFPIEDVGPWSEVKLDIVKLYAAAYSTILSAQRNPNLYHVYVDAFAGTGVHLSKATGQLISGSPLNALEVESPFREHYFIDLDREKVEALKTLAGTRPDVHILLGDANALIVSDVLPSVRYEDYRRGLCLLDPYGLDLKWVTVAAVAKAGSMEIFVNFPMMDMNRNVLWGNADAVSDAQRARMTEFWGDESWRSIAYTTQGSLFGWLRKEPSWVIAKAYQERLRTAAGFAYVPEPVAMYNRNNVIVYYLFFASHKPVAAKIVKQIFDKHRQRRI